jgi:hypothetical protein
MQLLTSIEDKNVVIRAIEENASMMRAANRAWLSICRG